MDDPSALPSPRQRWLASLAVFAVLAALSIIAIGNSAFYDDEIWTIHLLKSARSPADLIARANTADIHPPLGYLLDWLVWQALGSFKAVQLTKGLVNAGALACVAWLAGGQLDRRTWAVLVLLLASEASAIMWGASLRWYAWFNPLCVVTLAGLLWAPIGPRVSAALVVKAAIVLFHIGYLALIAVPVLALVWAGRFARGLGSRDWLWIAGIAAVGLALCLPQASVLLAVHLPAGSAARGSPLLAAALTGFTLALGNAVFPVSLAAAIALPTLAIALALAVGKARRLPGPQILWGAIALGAAGMVASGLGASPRNAVFLHLAALPLIAAVIAANGRRMRWIAIGVMAAFGMQALGNVAEHRGTIKRSYNTPYPAIVSQIEAWEKVCPRTVVAHGDVVLGYLLRPNLPQIGPYDAADRSLAKGTCLIVLRGSAAGSDRPRIAAWWANLGGLGSSVQSDIVYNPEPATQWIAAIIGRRVETSAARLTLYRLDDAVVIKAP